MYQQGSSELLSSPVAKLTLGKSVLLNVYHRRFNKSLHPHMMSPAILFW